MQLPDDIQHLLDHKRYISYPHSSCVPGGLLIYSFMVWIPARLKVTVRLPFNIVDTEVTVISDVTVTFKPLKKRTGYLLLSAAFFAKVMI